MKKILIIGASSYLGKTLAEYLIKKGYKVEQLSVRDDKWEKGSFQEIDVIYYVAAIVHRKEKDVSEKEWYRVNSELPLAVADKAKREGVHQFIFVSTMNVYGLQQGKIGSNMKPHPKSLYGKSKWKAEQELRKRSSKDFKVAILRPPMVYGKGCKGNYAILEKFAAVCPIFPEYSNKRSMIYIENLNQYVEKLIEKEEDGIFLPQDPEYVNTYEMIRLIRAAKKKRTWGIRIFNPLIRICIPYIGVFEKIWGNLYYEKKVSAIDSGICFCTLKEAIYAIEEKADLENGRKCYDKKQKGGGKHILVVSQYFYPEQFRINDICEEWVKRGHKVTVITGIPNYPLGKFYAGYGFFKNRESDYRGVKVIRIPIIPRGQRTFMLALNYISFVVSGFFWKTFTRVKANRVFIFQMSPVTQALVGIWYAKRRKIPCCIYVQDLWPESLVAITGISNRKILGIIDKVVDYVYSNSDVILGTSPSFVRKIEERTSSRYPDGTSKVKYWPQYAEDFYHPVEKKPLSDVEDDESFKIVFTGNIGYAQGLDILPKAAVLLKQQKVDCKFYIIGDGRYREQLEKEIAQSDVQDMFHFLGRKEPEEIPSYLAHFDVAFLSFADNPLFEMTIPAKLQSYMACGMPVLAVAGGETKRIIEEAKCGEVCELGDAIGTVKAIEKMMAMSMEDKRQKSENALIYCHKYFDRKSLLDKMERY